MSRKTSEAIYNSAYIKYKYQSMQKKVKEQSEELEVLKTKLFKMKKEYYNIMYYKVLARGNSVPTVYIQKRIEIREKMEELENGLDAH